MPYISSSPGYLKLLHPLLQGTQGEAESKALPTLRRGRVGADCCEFSLLSAGPGTWFLSP